MKRPIGWDNACSVFWETDLLVAPKQVQECMRKQLPYENLNPNNTDPIGALRLIVTTTLAVRDNDNPLVTIAMSQAIYTCVIALGNKYASIAKKLDLNRQAVIAHNQAKSAYNITRNDDDCLAMYDAQAKQYTAYWALINCLTHVVLGE